MDITLQDPETGRLARAVAELTGESLTEAVRKSLAERLERERQRRDDREARLARIREIAEHFARLPVLDDRSPDEIVGYDENGMWT